MAVAHSIANCNCIYFAKKKYQKSLLLIVYIITYTRLQWIRYVINLVFIMLDNYIWTVSFCLFSHLHTSTLLQYIKENIQINPESFSTMWRNSFLLPLALPMSKMEILVPIAFSFIYCGSVTHISGNIRCQ